MQMLSHSQSHTKQTTDKEFDVVEEDMKHNKDTANDFNDLESTGLAFISEPPRTGKRSKKLKRETIPSNNSVNESPLTIDISKSLQKTSSAAKKKSTSKSRAKNTSPNTPKISHVADSMKIIPTDFSNILEDGLKDVAAAAEQPSIEIRSTEKKTHSEDESEHQMQSQIKNQESGRVGFLFMFTFEARLKFLITLQFVSV
jgi:hypothetical protein